MPVAVLFIVLVVELLLAGSLLASMVWPERRVWPPPDKWSWQFWWIWSLTITRIRRVLSHCAQILRIEERMANDVVGEEAMKSWRTIVAWACFLTAAVSILFGIVLTCGLINEYGREY